VESRKVHFILTGKEFSYRYYVSIATAVETQKALITLWTTEYVKSPYLDRLDKYIETRRVTAPSFRSLKNQPPYFQKAHIKDYLAYKVLYDEGGMCLDLDTISIQDATDLIGDKEMMFMTDARKPYKWKLIYNSAIMAAKKGASLANTAVVMAEKILGQEEIIWGDSGPKIACHLAFNYPQLVSLPPIEVLGGFEGGEIPSMYGNVPLDPNLRVMHLLAYASKELYTAIDEEYIRTANTLIAKTVRNVLGDDI
jgi:hypothetical protein